MVQHEVVDRFNLGEMSRRWVDLLRTSRSISQALREKDLVLGVGTVDPDKIGQLTISGSLSLSLETAEGSHFNLVPAGNEDAVCYKAYEREKGAWDSTLDGSFSYYDPIHVNRIIVDIQSNGRAPISFIGREHAGWRRELHLPDIDQWQGYDLQPGTTEA